MWGFTKKWQTVFSNPVHCESQFGGQFWMLSVRVLAADWTRHLPLLSSPCTSLYMQVHQGGYLTPLPPPPGRKGGCREEAVRWFSFYCTSTGGLDSVLCSITNFHMTSGKSAFCVSMLQFPTVKHFCTFQRFTRFLANTVINSMNRWSSHPLTGGGTTPLMWGIWNLTPPAIYHPESFLGASGWGS